MMETRPHLLFRLSIKDRMSIFEFRKSEGNCGFGVWSCTLVILSASPRKKALESGALLRAAVRRALACALFSCDEHVQSCCFAWFCMPGATGKIAGYGSGPTLKNEEEDGCACLQHCLGQFLCPCLWPCWGASARNLLEERLALEHGATRSSATCCSPCCIDDVLLHFFCGCCATAQIARHEYAIPATGTVKYDCCSATGEP